jgi:hypothetical protein
MSSKYIFLKIMPYCDFFQKVGTLKNSNQIQILFGS